MTKGAVCILGEIWSKYDPDIANTRYYMYIGCVNLSYRDILQFFYVDGPGISNQSSYADNRTDAVDRLLIVALIWRPHCTGPDRSAVDIQYAAVYTEGILPSQYSVLAVYTANVIYYILQLSGYPAYILLETWFVNLCIAVYDHTAHTLQHSSSIPAVYTADLVECMFSVYCNYTSLYWISTALRSWGIQHGFHNTPLESGWEYTYFPSCVISFCNESWWAWNCFHQTQWLSLVCNITWLSSITLKGP